MTWTAPSTSSTRLLGGSDSYSWAVRTTGSETSSASRCGITAVMGHTSDRASPAYARVTYRVIRDERVGRVIPGPAAGPRRRRRGTAVRRGAGGTAGRGGTGTPDPALGQRRVGAAGRCAGDRRVGGRD